MRYTDEHLNEAVKNDIFSDEQVTQFRNYVKNANNHVSKFQMVLYYGGGLLIISALTWLMESSWDSFGALGMIIVSSLYITVFLIAGYIIFFKKRSWKLLEGSYWLFP